MDQEKIRKLIESLTDEQKKKAMACKNSKEFFSLLAELGVALPDEALDAASGGWSQTWGSWQDFTDASGSPADTSVDDVSEKQEPGKFGLPKTFF